MVLRFRYSTKRRLEYWSEGSEKEGEGIHALHTNTQIRIGEERTNR